jgi:outer membrane protein OmpA-like peptidoglycan-associated protein
MRTVGLILTTVLLGVASAAWWRDFGPSDSLDWPSGGDRQVPPVSSAAALAPADIGRRSDLAALESESSAPPGASPAAGDSVVPPSGPGSGVQGVQGVKPTPARSSSTRDLGSAVELSAPPATALSTSSGATRPIGVAAERVAALSVTAAGHAVAPPPTETRAHPSPPEPGATTMAPAVTGQSFEVPRIAAQLVSERRAATVYFALDESELLPAATATLMELVADLRDADMVMRIQVDGHCDDTGADDYNQTLSERRASAVVAFLNQQGLVAADQVTRGFGERVRAVPGTDQSSRALNRRARVRIDWVSRRQLDVSQVQSTAP